MGGSQSQDDPVFVAGDGDYVLEIVSGSRYQDALEWLVQGRGEEPADYSCMAVLEHDFDLRAVTVSIRGVRVGFLAPDAAASLIEAMQTWGFTRATCAAVIEGGWYRSADDKGDFSVWLDANPDFVPAARPSADRSARHLPVAIVAPNADARKTGRDLVFGALATLALVAAIGIVWLIVEQRSEPVIGDRLAVSSPAQTRPPPPPADPSLRLAEVREPSVATAVVRRDRKPEAATPVRPASVPAITAPGVWTQRPQVSTAVAEAPPLPSHAPMSAIRLAAIDSAAGNRSRGAPASKAAGISPERTMSRAIEERKILVAALPAEAAKEVRPVRERATMLVAAAPLAATLVAAPTAAVFSSTMLEPPPETQAAAPSPRSDRAAERAKARSERRAARERARSRNAARSNKRYRRAPQRQPAASQAAGSNAVVAQPPKTEAARMFEAWAREWSSAAQQGLRPPAPRAR